METLFYKESKILKWFFNGYYSFFNTCNCKSIFIPEYDIANVNEYFIENDFFGKPNIAEKYYKVTICINLTSQCNLRCKYCFNDKSKNNTLNLDSCFEFINKKILENNYAHKYFIDLSGSGEPLLYLDKIIEIAKFCKRKSDEIGKEIIPMLATNGTLLNENIAKLLQDNAVLFGISIDGYKELHDKQRIDINGKGTYDKIIQNFSKIKFKTYIGSAMTVYDENTDIYKAYRNLMNIFETVSIRFARMDYSNFDFSYILDGYRKIIDFILKEIANNDISSLLKIINGDDYFGKMILKIMSNTYLVRRCDAGRGRFSLGSDGKEYPCSACVFDNDIEELFKENDYCSTCNIHGFCGGICPIQLKRNKGTYKLCEFKRKLFELCLEFVGNIYIYYFDTYCLIIEKATMIISRYLYDKELDDAYIKNKDKIAFTKLKEIKDNNYSLFCTYK